jgi:hypothetical protein
VWRPADAGAAIAGVCLVVGLLLVALTDDAFGWFDGLNAFVAYALIFVLIFGDAVVPILPGETVLNAASVRASSGELKLPPI